MATAFNLKATYGDRYRVTVEESHRAERGHDQMRAVDPWLWQIRCKSPPSTAIAPWGELDSETELAVICGWRGPLGNRLAALPFTTLLQDGDDGKTVGFHHRHFAEVAAMVKPYRRRRLSEEQRAEGAARLALWRKQKRSSGDPERAIGLGATPDTTNADRAKSGPASGVLRDPGATDDRSALSKDPPA